MAVTASMACELRIGLPALIDFEFGELGAVRLDQLGELHQDFRARRTGLFLPGRERRQRRPHGRSMSSSSHSAR